MLKLGEHPDRLSTSENAFPDPDAKRTNRLRSDVAGSVFVHILLVIDEVLPMIRCLVFLTTVVIGSQYVTSMDIVSRAAKKILKRSNGKTIDRVERDKDGNVIRLLLNDMDLTTSEAAEIGCLEHLRSLVLFRTNFTDLHMTQIKNCKRLEHLNLTSTEVTDKSIDTILGFRARYG